MLETNPKSSSLKGMVEDILSSHHEPTRELISRAKEILSRAGEAFPDNDFLKKLGMAFQSLVMTMNMHMEKEEEVLFPMFLRIEDGFDSLKHCGGIENPIRIMEQEHKELDLALERLRALTQDYHVSAAMLQVIRGFYDVLEAFENDLRVHSEKEECELFPAAIAREKSISASKQG